jgi:hypothetical protein
MGLLHGRRLTQVHVSSSNIYPGANELLQQLPPPPQQQQQQHGASAAPVLPLEANKNSKAAPAAATQPVATPAVMNSSTPNAALLGAVSDLLCNLDTTNAAAVAEAAEAVAATVRGAAAGLEQPAEQQQPQQQKQHQKHLSQASTAAASQDAQQHTASRGGGSVMTGRRADQTMAADACEGALQMQQVGATKATPAAAAAQQEQQQQCVSDQEMLQQQELQLQERSEDAHLPFSGPMAHRYGAAAASGLGPAGLALVKQELGALPIQQQLQYWQLADKPFDALELQQLVTHYLLPGMAETLAGRANRSGRARPAMVQVPDIVHRQYAVLAPSLHGLMAQLQQEHPGDIISSKGSSSGRKGKRKAADQAGSFVESPAAVVLLRALRCLQLWETRQVTQPHMPTLLQRLAEERGGAAAATTAAATGSSGDAGMDVLEIVDLTGDCDADDQGQPGEASCESVQLQEFLAGQVDVLLVREQQGRQVSSGAGVAHGVRVKDELEG